MKQERALEFNLTEEFPHLPTAPIVEAVIHWAARAEKPLKLEGLQTLLSERLPEYPECQPQHELQFEAQFAANGSATQIRRDTWQGLRLTSSDKLHIVQFNRDGIVFSRLAPYQSWEVFSAEGLRLWRIFIELAEPSEVQRLGVRFINRIAPVDLGNLRRHLERPPKCLEPLGLPMSSFLYQSAHEVPGHPFKINVVQTVQPPPPTHGNGFGLIVDIDVCTTQPLHPDEESVRKHLASMRWLKNTAFFSLVSKKALESFQEEKK